MTWRISTSVRRENSVHDGPTFQFLSERCMRLLKVRWQSVEEAHGTNTYHKFLDSLRVQEPKLICARISNMLRKSKLLLTSKKLMMTLKFVYVRVDTILTIIVVMFLSKCFSSIEPLKYFSHVLFHYGQIHNHTWNSLRFTL